MLFLGLDKIYQFQSKKLGIFDFIKPKKEQKTSEEILQRLLDYMPNVHMQGKEFTNCVAHVKRGEYILAVDSLIELTSGTNHYFSNEFWKELLKVCTELKLPGQALYCGKQLVRNAASPSCSPFFGSTMNKINNTCYEAHTSEKIKDEWANERREKDKVEKLIEKDGIYLKPHGRSGTLYYVKNGRITEIEFELGMNGLILWFDSVNQWSLPNKKNLTKDEKEEIKNAIVEWSKRTGNAVDFD